MRKALVIGIDSYPSMPLHGCVNDARCIADLLATNGDGSPNFSVKKLVSDDITVTTSQMRDSIKELFTGAADTVLLFFAGHGIIDQQTNAGFIVSQNGSSDSWGVSLSEVLSLANQAHPRIKSTVIILDSCQSGFAGELTRLGSAGGPSVVGNGVTILTACHREGTAAEQGGQGLFTHLVVDGLRGSAADICGRITPAAVYSHVDQTLGPWEQRPIYKANVQTFVVLREVDAKIDKSILRRLPEYFPEPGSIFPLDPECEPDRGSEAGPLNHIPVVEEKVSGYRKMQMCNRHGLVVPVGQPHMWHAAIHSTGCKLTALGVHYRKLAEMKRI